MHEKIDSAHEIPGVRMRRAGLLLAARVYAVLMLSLARTPKGGFEEGLVKKVLGMIPWLLKTASLCIGKYYRLVRSVLYHVSEG